MFGDNGGKLRNGAGLGVSRKDQMQDRHEMAFAAAETAMQIGRLAGISRNSALDQCERGVETLLQLRRNDVAVDRLGRACYSLSQPENEIAPVNLLGQIQKVFDKSSHVVSS